MVSHIAYRCPHPDCGNRTLRVEGDRLVCGSGHSYAYAPGTKIPVFAESQSDSNEYSIENAAEIHDNSLRWLFKTFGTDEDTLRGNLVSRLRLRKGQSLLVTGAGAGNDLPYLASLMQGEGTIFAQDIARPMLVAGAARHEKTVTSMGVDIHFSVSDATCLPFEDRVFDAAYHFGGLNIYPDVAKGIAEMDRVVKPGGRVVISDEGLAPWLKQTEIGKQLISNNSLYNFDVPIADIPETARDVIISWEMHNCFFVIDYTVGDGPLPIDIDVPHVGKRGGTIRTRYFGQLEGVDPGLKDLIYKKAEALGVSRVDYLETVLRNALEK